MKSGNSWMLEEEITHIYTPKHISALLVPVITNSPVTPLILFLEEKYMEINTFNALAPPRTGNNI